MGDRFRRASAILMVVVLIACDTPGTGLRPPVGVDLDAIFLPATAVEIAQVESEWASRHPRAQGVVLQKSELVLMAGGFGTARVYSHLVDGHRHYGAVLVPLGAATGSLPVVIFTHGGDTGVNVGEVALTLLLLGDRARDFAYVIPSFRSETLTLGGSVFRSEGAPSPWDRDVDDALALLEVAIERTPEIDPSRIGVLGASRGGMVGLLMAIRDPRIDLVSAIAGPTDFLGPWVRGLTRDALVGELRPLPGIRVLNERFIQPLAAGSITPAEYRRELVRRSPVLWAHRLPPVQLHHGTADDVVPVAQAESLIAALGRLPRSGMHDDFHFYPDAGHNVLELREVDARILGFLQRLRQ
jgi:dipeptidyl aminopeptidase/acylaminoacyl peptidase